MNNLKFKRSDIQKTLKVKSESSIDGKENTDLTNTKMKYKTMHKKHSTLVHDYNTFSNNTSIQKKQFTNCSSIKNFLINENISKDLNDSIDYYIKTDEDKDKDFTSNRNIIKNRMVSKRSSKFSSKYSSTSKPSSCNKYNLYNPQTPKVNNKINHSKVSKVTSKCYTNNTNTSCEESLEEETVKIDYKKQPKFLTRPPVKNDQEEMFWFAAYNELMIEEEMQLVMSQINNKDIRNQLAFINNYNLNINKNEWVVTKSQEHEEKFLFTRLFLLSSSQLKYLYNYMNRDFSFKSPIENVFSTITTDKKIKIENKYFQSKYSEILCLGYYLNTKILTFSSPKSLIIENDKQLNASSLSKQQQYTISKLSSLIEIIQSQYSITENEDNYMFSKGFIQNYIINKINTFFNLYSGNIIENDSLSIISQDSLIKENNLLIERTMKSNLNVKKVDSCSTYYKTNKEEIEEKNFNGQISSFGLKNQTSDTIKSSKNIHVVKRDCFDSQFPTESDFNDDKDAKKFVSFLNGSGIKSEKSYNGDEVYMTPKKIKSTKGNCYIK